MKELCVLALRALCWLLWLVLRAFVAVARKPHCTFVEPATQSPYLTRWWLGARGAWPDAEGRTAQQGWYLHCFHRSDNARDLHSHPTLFALAWVLRGGYSELRREGINGELIYTRHRPGQLNVLTDKTFHRTTLLGSSSWSLIYFGPRAGGWGFAKDDGTVQRADHTDGRTGETKPREERATP